MQKKARGNLAEDLVAKRLSDQGFVIRHRNRTIRGGELDIVCVRETVLVFVEVRSVDHMDDLHEYVTPKKLKHLFHTIEAYVLAHARQEAYRLDVIFVKENSVLERCQNVTNN